MSRSKAELIAQRQVVAEADALLITAGAGMGVDSGLPDFRGDKGFWKAYPPFERLGVSFVDMANPAWFARDPELAWGFYGHRLQLYRGNDATPRIRILQRWAPGPRSRQFRLHVECGRPVPTGRFRDAIG